METSPSKTPIYRPPSFNRFADIAGFTHWSSSRDAEQVFTLLETLYGAFDAMALRRVVFKVCVHSVVKQYVLDMVDSIFEPRP